MLHVRKANLILLAYENDILNNVPVELFLKRFHKSKDRRLQLY